MTLVSVRRASSLWRAVEQGFKSATLPLAARWLARPEPAEPRGTVASPGTVAPAGMAAPHGSRQLPATVRGRAEALSPEAARRILVVRHDNRLGNLILLTPFLQRLREAVPGSHIACLTGERYAPLLRGWPWVDQWIIQEKRRHARFPWLFLPWVAGVRRQGWEVAFEASNHNTHSYYNCLMTLASGAPRRVGFDHPRSQAALTRLVGPPHEELHFSLAPLRLLRAVGWTAASAPMSCPLPQPPAPALAAWRERERLGDGYLVAHLGGRGGKAWPLSAWAALLPRLAEEIGGRIVLVSGPEEMHRLAGLSFTGGERLVRAPGLAVQDLAHLLRAARGYVGCDSGVMHLAVALGIPTVALFFQSNPYHYGPLGSRHRTVLLADPYQVRDAVWARPLEGLARSPLIRAESAAEASLEGLPATGPEAVEAVLRAAREAVCAERRSEDRQEEE